MVMVGRMTALIALAWAVCGWAQVAAPVVGQPAPPKEVRPMDATVPLIGEAIHLSDFVGADGEMGPRPALREKLTEVKGFIQNGPVDGDAATEQTEAWLGRTGTTLYVVFVCHDRKPSAIRGHLARRENIFTDDNVSVLLDPFQDRRKGVLFALNPVGVQADAAWSEGNGQDFSYDTVWDSEGQVTKTGWMALFAIPFRSLRFRSTSSEWGVVLARKMPRKSEADYWPRVAANVSGMLTQEATLRGMEGATGSHNLQVNPYVLAQNERTLDNLNPLTPFFSNRKFEATAGADVKAIVHDTIVLDATVNPDFSQVESDQPQFTVNQRYSVYFPELRPFFLENASYFSTPITLVYTRNVGHPEFGFRATGKLGKTNIGVLTIDDRAPGEGRSASDPLYKNRAIFGVGRVSQDIGKGSSVGLTYADREFEGSWNRIGGVDFSARLNSTMTVSGQVVESATKNQDGSYSAGPGSYLEFNRSGHSFNLDNTYQDYSSGFVSRTGFIPTTNLRSDQQHMTYLWFPKHSRVQGYGIENNYQIAFDHQGNRLYRYITSDPLMLLPGKMVIAPIGGQNSDTLGPQSGYGFTKNRNFTENFGGLVFKGAPRPQFSFNFTLIHGGNVNYNPVAGALPKLLHQETVQALVTVQPLRALTVDNIYLLDRNHTAAGGADVYENQTLRTKINYQFTRAFSARVIVQYNSLLVNPAQTSLTRTKQVGTQVLFTWLPHPGTAIYAGFNNDLQNLDRQLCTRVAGGAGCDPNSPPLARAPGYLNDGRQFFVKASYLLRF